MLNHQCFFAIQNVLLNFKSGIKNNLKWSTDV